MQLVNDGLWDWRPGPWAGECSAWERKGCGRLGKAPRNSRSASPASSRQAGSALLPAARKPQGGGGCGGYSRKSHVSLKPGRTGWGTGMNQGAGFAFSLRSKSWDTWTSLLQARFMLATPCPRPRAGLVLSSPTLTLHLRKGSLSALPLSISRLRTCLLVLSGLLTLNLPSSLWPSGGEEGYLLDIGRGGLWSLMLSHFLLYGLK